MEMLIMSYACKSNSCTNIIGVIPCLPYSAQSKSIEFASDVLKTKMDFLAQFQSVFRDINNIVMEMLIMAYACKTSTCRKIVGVIPYVPYSRQCKRLQLTKFEFSRLFLVGSLTAYNSAVPRDTK